MFLIVQNDPECPAGTCAGLLSARGDRYRTVAGYSGDPFPDPLSLAGVIVLGGEMSVYQTERFPYLDRVRHFIAAALKAKTPLLGICLGGQLLAQVAGGTVASPSRHGEKGISRVDLNDDGLADPLFAGLGRSFTTFQLHNDSFTVPPSGTLLASSPACPAQAFRLGGCAYGVQFHPEVDPSIVAAWGAFSFPAEDYLAGFLAQKSAFDAASTAILANFLSLALTSRPS